MRVLLDTHVYLWVLANDRRLPQSFRDVIADPRNMKLVSSLTMAEIAVKQTIGKLTIDGALPDDLVARGLDELPFTHGHAKVMHSLPLLHRDPFDRMLIAQAIAEDTVFLTLDPACTQYDVPLLVAD